jgi:hypothetical protein
MWIFNAIANAIGATFIGQPNYIVTSFQNRVAADGGTFEAPLCLNAFLTSLQNIS